MRRLIVMLIVLCMASVVYAQVRGGVPAPFPGVAPVPFYGPSTSVIDRNGNLLVFDALYSYPTPMPAQPVILQPTPAKTRVTVITTDGTAKPPVEYDGAFQVVGAGWYAVYAIVNAYVAGPTAVPPTRRLLAFNVVAGVPLSPLPAIDVPLRAEVQLSAARDSSGSDLISFVDPLSDPLILAPTAGTAPIARRFAQILKYTGGTNFVAGTPIPLP